LRLHRSDGLLCGRLRRDPKRDAFAPARLCLEDHVGGWWECSAPERSDWPHAKFARTRHFPNRACAARAIAFDGLDIPGAFQ
jgi:hypothetical protein